MLKVAIVGATGVVGQEFIVALDRHPWFSVEAIAASERSAGKRYIDALRDSATGIMKWHQHRPVPEYARDMVVKSVGEIDARDYDLIFTAVETDDARVIEPRLAQHTPVISTAAAFRYEQDVPILIPGINDDHAELLNVQRERRQWQGFIAPLPNCTTTGLAITLKPIMDAFGIERVIMTSLQAVSGAGRSPGVAALDIFDNIIPFIPKEEEKVQVEAKKILGRFTDGRIDDARFRVSCTCTRVPVIDGHTESAFVETSRECEPEDVKQAMLRYSRGVSVRGLPSAPEEYIIVHDDPSRPQPRLDRDTNDGMSTVVGRIRKDTAFERGVKYVLLSHNEKMGSAKGAVLLAEMLKTRELL
ncbi:MAG: aspartate-semialdehyde dehydrogenase [Candidatus Nitrosocaldus sp.]|nr:aspartate-semialdehyde dehydrogenase [Candidatus Nitrosocaldus sp.]MCS7140804.1 aspartate-semialdehyde dehydrogenase [Candidatus Nitrosocaldus sp.]MDW7999732.1 aspartate-semialdehyde dehydrogenase [Candidatus Nitrosocaldus sp.]MDW8274908.1 aspartate-semialdehyde dehydrogenase [Candidatus Nitrosocaldus sp.]